MRILFYSRLCCLLLLLNACAAQDHYHSYKPYNDLRLHGELAIGVFSYKTYDDGHVQHPNRILNTSGNPIELDESVAALVRKNTGYELYHSGMEIRQEASLVLTGDVLELKVDDSLPPARWTYIVEYSIARKSDGKVLFSKRCQPQTLDSARRYALPSGYKPSIEQLILEGYEEFFDDPRVRALLER